jgi:tetratricopeptide (TPR) repeat protein
MTAVAEWEIWAREGERLLAARRLPEAEECFVRALALGAGAGSHAGLGLTRLARGARAEGELELIEATRLDPRCEWGWYGRGVAAAQRGAVADARRCLERVLALNPENPDAQAALALLRDAAP